MISGSSGRRDAEDLGEWTIQFLKGIPRWRTVQRRMLDAVYFGWQPINLVWDDCLAWRGGRYWGLRNFFSLYLKRVDSWQLHDSSPISGPRLIASGNLAEAPEVEDPDLWEDLRVLANSR